MRFGSSGASGHIIAVNGLKYAMKGLTCGFRVRYLDENASRGRPNVETAKQVLSQVAEATAEGATERNVLFQDVRQLAAGGNTFQLEVTATIRDYGPGYPANRYYGDTCIGKFEKEKYSFWTDGTAWQVDGRLTAPTHKCDKNPSGAPAAQGRTAAAPQPTRSGVMVEGVYECWSGRTANLTLNFTIRAGGQYVDAEGKAGTFSVNAANSRVNFRGGVLDGEIPAGMYAMYYEPQGRPTLSIRNKDGDEVVACQKR
jgi:hypothetical protein